MHSHIHITKQEIQNETDQLISDNFKKVKQWLIERGIMFHIVEVDEYDDELDIKAVKSMSSILTKMRMNPWKLKDIPFGDKPSVVISLNVQRVFW